MLFGEADPLGGWLQVVLQGGALTLLAYIIMFLAPNLIRDARLERNQRDETFQKMINVLNDRFEQRSQTIVNSIEKQTGVLSGELKTLSAAINKTLGK